MEKSSCDLEGTLGLVLPNGVCSPASTNDVPLPSEKQHSSASVDAAGTGEDTGSSLEAQICVEFSESVSLERVKKGLHKSSTFPTSAGEEAGQGDGSSCRADECVKDAPAYERSMSLPPTLKPISAMKGSRQKNGVDLPMENRRVKWAPDVYDPPVTSVCHSVNSNYHYQRRSKSRKKEKNKPKKKPKTKSKKSHHNAIQNSSVLQTPDLGLEEPGGQSSLKDLGKREAVILDAKCGSSFLRESVANMHFSIAEAS